jgi:hypothetical protein
MAFYLGVFDIAHRAVSGIRIYYVSDGIWELGYIL